MLKKISFTVAALAFAATCSSAIADNNGNDKKVGKAPVKPIPMVSNDNPRCKGLPSFTELQTALKTAHEKANGGFNFDMWGTIVNRDGEVCAVANTGAKLGDQWPGSRVISAQKANTANAFSLPNFALSTANLYSAVQPGGSLFGLQESNPVDVSVAYQGTSSNFGTKKDPMVGKKIGGVNVFGGGLALYNATGVLVGAVGVSGDSSCADHNIAWRTRYELGLNYVKKGVTDDKKDNIIFDLDAAGKSLSGWGHPACGATSQAANDLVLNNDIPVLPAPVVAPAPLLTEAK